MGVLDGLPIHRKQQQPEPAPKKKRKTLSPAQKLKNEELAYVRGLKERDPAQYDRVMAKRLGLGGDREDDALDRMIKDQKRVQELLRLYGGKPGRAATADGIAGTISDFVNSEAAVELVKTFGNIFGAGQTETPRESNPGHADHGGPAPAQPEPKQLPERARTPEEIGMKLLDDVQKNIGNDTATTAAAKLKTAATPASPFHNADAQGLVQVLLTVAATPEGITQYAVNRLQDPNGTPIHPLINWLISTEPAKDYPSRFEWSVAVVAELHRLYGVPLVPDGAPASPNGQASGF